MGNNRETSPNFSRENGSGKQHLGDARETRVDNRLPLEPLVDASLEDILSGRVGGVDSHGRRIVRGSLLD